MTFGHRERALEGSLKKIYLSISGEITTSPKLVVIHGRPKERGRNNFPKQAHRFGSDLFDLESQKLKE